MRPRAALCAVLTAVGVLVAGCRRGAGPSSGSDRPPPTAVVVALFDVSGSTKGAAIRERYVRELGKVIAVLHGGERVVGDRITENSLVSSSFPIDCTLPASEALGNPLLFQGRLRKAVASLRSDAGEAIRTMAPAPHTDIFNALFNAQKVFHSERNRGARRKALVMLSDMVEQTPRRDLTGMTLTPRDAERVIAEDRAAGRLPDLKGVVVWVAGAGVTTDRILPDAKLLRIQRFWVAYFRACGADLTDDRYGAALVDFELR